MNKDLKDFCEKAHEEVKRLPKELQKIKITIEHQGRQVIITWPNPEKPDLTPAQLAERALKKLQA